MATDDDAPAKIDPRPSEPPAATHDDAPRRTRPVSVAPEPKHDKLGERPARSTAGGGAKEIDKLGERPARSTAGGGAKEIDKDDGITESIRQRLEHLVPELVKKTFAAGMGAVFQTEEGIRKIARDVSLPDVAGYIASSADGAKDKVFEIIARETREFLSNLNLTDEIAKLLTTLSFEIKTEVRFIPNSERFIGAEPDVKASVRLKRADKDDKKDKDKDKDEDHSRLRFWRRDERDGNDTPDK